jgi:DNA-binding beta-propeller fold protein YncE
MNAGRARALLFAAAGIVPVGCGAGIRSLPPFFSAHSAAAGANAVAASGRTSVTFSVKVPRAGGPAALAFVVDRGTPAQQNGTLELATGATGCTNPTRALAATCALVLDLSPGAHVVDVGVPDATPAAGTTASVIAGLPFTVVSGNGNAVRLALQGTPAAVAVIPMPQQDVQGAQSSGFDVYGFFKADGMTRYNRTFVAAATDADGAYIVGAGAPPITFVSSDPEVWSNGIPAAANPHAFVVNAREYDLSEAVRFTVTATPDDGTPVVANVRLRIAALNAPRIYVASHLGGRPCAGSSASGSISVYDEQGNPLEVPGSFAGLCGATGIAYVPKLHRLYAAQEYGDAIVAYDLDGHRVETPGGFPGLSSPVGIAYDAAHDRLIAGNVDAPLAAYDLDGNELAAPVKPNEAAGAAPSLPYGILAEPRTGHVYVADTGSNRVAVFDANGNALTSWPVPSGANALAQDTASGNLYVTDDDHNVHVFDRRGNVIPQPCRMASYGCIGERPWSEAKSPMGIAQSPGNGWFYVANYANNTITAYDKNGVRVATSGSGFRAPSGTTNGPIGIAIVP